MDELEVVGHALGHTPNTTYDHSLDSLGEEEEEEDRSSSADSLSEDEEERR